MIFWPHKDDALSSICTIFVAGCIMIWGNPVGGGGASLNFQYNGPVLYAIKNGPNQI